MPSETKQTSTEDTSSAQIVSETQDGAVVSKEEGSLDAAPTDAQIKRKKRKKRYLAPYDQRRMVQAIGRVEGRILQTDNGVRLVTEDRAEFPISSIGRSQLAVRLLGLPDSQRFGKFAFWPAFSREGIIIISFNNSDDWEPQENSPPVDQMFLCGTLQEVKSDRFSVLVGYELKKKGKRVDRLLTVESAPLPEWKVDGWVDLILHRQGQDWQWQGDFHPRGPKVGGGFNSWLPYKEAKSTAVEP